MGDRALLEVDLNVTVALILLIASALFGCATGLFFRVWTLVPASLLLAIVSATCLRARGYGFAGGISVTVGCLVISQLAYLAASFLRFGWSEADSLMKEIDGDPDGRGEHDVGGQDE